MLLTNQKTINYEIYINTEGNHPFHFASAKVCNKTTFFIKKKSLTYHSQKHLILGSYFFT